MLIQRAYKTRLHPTPAQVATLRHHSDVTRFVYNWALARREEHYKATGEHLSSVTLIKAFRAQRKGAWPWTVGAASRCEESALKALDAAYQRWFDICKGKVPKPMRRGRPRKDGKPSGFPRFRSRLRGTMSFAFWGVAPEHIQADRVRLQAIGWVKIGERDYLPTGGVKINRATVSERAGRWFISIQVEQEVPDEQATGAAVGVDVGIKALATTSDGVQYDNPKALYAAEQHLAKLQRRLDRQEKGSGRREDTKLQIGQLHYRIANLRQHTIHNVTADIVGRHRGPEGRPACVVIEDLNVAGMLQNHKLARALSDASMSELHRQLAYKTVWCGSSLQKADRWFPSSKTCSACGAVRALLVLSERTFVCAECGHTLDRDENAAINLMHLAPEPGERLNCTRRAEAEVGSTVVDAL